MTLTQVDCGLSERGFIKKNYTIFVVKDSMINFMKKIQ